MEVKGDTVMLSGFVSGAFFAERYRLENLLGSGAMGKVYEATDMLHDRRVALKVLHPDKARKPQVLARFRREAEILRNLGHPGIVQILESGQSSDGVDFLSMELLQGQTLKDRVRAEGPVAPEQLLPLLVQLCDALAAAHAQGVIHRDLKPENVFLADGPDGPRVKVVDFGLSRLSTNERITKTGVMIGTPRYMAPEQIRSSKDVDERTDIYACGVMVHEALVGASPFPAEDAAQLLGCVIENRVLKLEEVQPSLPAALGPVVRRAMAKEPRDRYATTGAFAEAFAAALGRRTGRSQLLEGGVDALFDSTSEPGAAPDPLEVPERSSGADDRPRFTLPPSVPSAQPERARRRGGGEKPRDGKRGPPAAVLALAIFAIAVVAVACLGGAVALGLRGCM